MKHTFITGCFLVLLCSATAYGQNYKDFVQKAETAFKQGDYTLAGKLYQDALGLASRTDEQAINNKINEVADCKTQLQAADNLFKEKLYTPALQVYTSLFFKSPYFSNLLKKIKECSKHSDMPEIIKLLSTLIETDQNNGYKELENTLQSELSNMTQQLETLRQTLQDGNEQEEKAKQETRDVLDNFLQKLEAAIKQPKPASNCLFRNQNLALFGIKQINKGNWKHPATYLGILAGAGTVTSLYYVGYAKYRIKKNDFKYLVNQQDYKDMCTEGWIAAILCYSVNIAANYWVADKPEKKNSEGSKPGFNIIPVTTPQYSGISLTYNF